MDTVTSISEAEYFFKSKQCGQTRISLGNVVILNIYSVFYSVNKVIFYKNKYFNKKKEIMIKTFLNWVNEINSLI